MTGLSYAPNHRNFTRHAWQIDQEEWGGDFEHTQVYPNLRVNTTLAISLWVTEKQRKEESRLKASFWCAVGFGIRQCEI